MRTPESFLIEVEIIKSSLLMNPYTFNTRIVQYNRVDYIEHKKAKEKIKLNWITRLKKSVYKAEIKNLF